MDNTIEKAREIARLVAQIDELESQLEALIGGNAPVHATGSTGSFGKAGPFEKFEKKFRAPHTCKNCGEQGHTRRTCTRAAIGTTGLMTDEMEQRARELANDGLSSSEIALELDVPESVVKKVLGRQTI